MDQLVVGVTGHRWNKLPEAGRPRVRSALAAILAEVDDTAPTGVTLLSGMAEGTDQIAVAEAPPHWRVIALLPMRVEAFRRDFAPDRATDGIDRSVELDTALARAASVIELPGGPEAYAAQGRALVERCSILVAVWDGAPAAGAGGTAEVVAAARAAGRTVHVVDPGGV